MPIRPQSKEVRALLVAVKAGDVDGVSALIRAGTPVDSRDRFGATPLMQAIELQHGDLVRALIVEHGADVGAGTDRFNYTPLHHAASFPSLEITRLLLERGASVDPLDSIGKTPLYHAVERRQLAQARLLLDAGADPNLPTHQQSALDEALRLQHEEIADLLLTHGANVNRRNADGVTPLLYAALRHDAAAVAYLLRHGADRAAQDNEGRDVRAYVAMDEMPDAHRIDEDAYLCQTLAALGEG